MNQIFDDLGNIRVNWEATEAGLSPFFVGGNPDAILELRESVLPDLIEALSDKDLFVVVHVLLTQISGLEHQVFPKWNGLVVDIAADGTVTIDSEQRFDLARRWERWFHAEPRLKSLPSGD